MGKVTSKDGTAIGFDRAGQGPAIVLVDGAMSYRAFGLGPLAELLKPHFTVITYDRRGRGESGDKKPYALEREVEDIEALVNQAGGSAFLFGTSSGACLALEATLRLGNKVKGLAMWEPPYNSDPADRPIWQGYWKELNELAAANRRGDMVTLFMRFVSVPADQIEGMRQSPMWPMFEAVAPTLVYDATAVGGGDRSVPVDRAARLSRPTLVMNGTVIPFMRPTAIALAKAIPHAQQRTLEGQSHDVDMKILAPLLVEFFTQ